MSTDWPGRGEWQDVSGNLYKLSEFEGMGKWGKVQSVSLIL
jgi:hypothetical protein